MDEISARVFSLRNDEGSDGDPGVISKSVVTYDFASFMILFNDIFMKDEYYTNFGMTDDVMTSNIIGQGAQFEAKMVRLSPSMSLRTSSDASSRLTEGRIIVLKRPRLSLDPSTHRFTEAGTIASIVNEFRVISHPALRHHPNILNVYGFAWETEEHLPGISVWPIIMVEYGDLGALDQYLSDRLESLTIESKLRLAGGVAAAINALHKCRIIHSDLKPGNVMIVHGPDGDAVAKLSDFGVSLILDERKSPSRWMEGSPGWMAPEWQTFVTNSELFSTDVYSCGLLFWSILLDGKTPWSLDVFRSQDGLLSFEEAKRTEEGLVDIALASILESTAIPEERADEICSILRSLLAPASERSLAPLLQHSDAVRVPDMTSLPLTPISGVAVNDRQMFPDYKELQDLPHPVQTQLLESISKIGLTENETLQRKADACYTVAILQLQRIGTVRPKEFQATDYVGYQIDCEVIMKWMRRAAELGSPPAQAMYYPLNQALGTYLETQGSLSRRSFLEPDDLPLVVTWLKNGTLLGSGIASQCLRDLDPSAWEQCRSIFSSKYCGVGRVLFSEEAAQALDQLISTPGDISASDMVGRNGDTLLHLAATIGRTNDVITLCQGISLKDLNRQNDRGETPLLQATRSGHFAIAKYLLELGADANLTTSNEENVLHWVSSLMANEEEELRAIVGTMIKSGAYLEQVCTETTIFNPYFSSPISAGTPLRRAVHRNAYTAAKVLVESGADPYNGEGNFPMALACSLHQTRFIGLFLEADCSVRLPAWHDRPGLWDPQYSWEVLKAKWRKEKTYQSGAPNAWESMKERGTEKSLLGYVVFPESFFRRLVLHGAQYLQQMQLSVQVIANIGYQDFRRVTWDYQSAIFHAIQSRDVSIVSYLHETFPEETRKALTDPALTSLGACLPIQLALMVGDWPIFNILLHLAGPDEVVQFMKIEGLTDNWLSQTAMWIFKKRSTIASHHVSHSFSNLIHLAVAAQPDPLFLEAILSQLPPNEAKELVNSHGYADELPLSMAVCRHFFAVADVLLKYGSDIEEEGNQPPNGQGLRTSCLGVNLTFNNRGTARAISWMLQHNPSFIVNKEHDVSALSMAIRAGGAFETSEKSPLVPVRLHQENTLALESILDHFSDPALINHQWKEEKAMYGMTALHWAVMRMQPEATKLLLAAGADPELKMRLFDGSTWLTARELALGFDEDTLSDEVKMKGEAEIRRFLKRIEEVQRLFVEQTPQ